MRVHDLLRLYLCMGFIFECIYLGSCVYGRSCMSIHFLFWLYCISCTYRKRKQNFKKIKIILIIVAGSNCINAQLFIAISTEPQLAKSVGVPSKYLKFEH